MHYTGTLQDGTEFDSSIPRYYIKVTGCLFVRKDLANRQTDKVLLYNLTSYMSWKGVLLC